MMYRLVLVLVWLLASSVSQAATYYADSTIASSDCVGTYNPQNRTCTGGSATAYNTLNEATAVLAAGDTLYVRAGTWIQSFNIGTKAGTANAYITLAAYPGETVTIAAGEPFSNSGLYRLENAFIIVDGFIFDGINAGNATYLSVGNGAHDIIIRNNEFKRWKGNGIFVSMSPTNNNSGANNITVKNNHIHHQSSQCGCNGERWYGIYSHSGANILLDGNVIYNNPGGGIQAYPGPLSNLIIRNNEVHENNTLSVSSVGGILLQGSSGHVITNAQIYNNLVYNNGSAAGAGIARGIQINQYTNGTKVWNNTSYGNNSVGIQVGPDATQLANTVVQNNISNNNSANYSDVGANTTADHNLTANPNFVNAAAFNFNLQTSSPAIDAGVTLSQVIMDIKKTPRPQGFAYDIGAYEGGGSSDIVPPQRPVGLVIR